jgi:hypothetical protein
MFVGYAPVWEGSPTEIIVRKEERERTGKEGDGE